VEALELQRCRVCFGGTEDGPLIRLTCACRGEMALIHDECARKWFTRKRSGTCELCQQPAYALPPPAALSVAERAALRRAAGGTAPGARKATVLIAIVLTLGLILADALGLLVPPLRCRRLNMPIAIGPLALLVAGFRHRVHDALPRSVTQSWHAVGLLLSVGVLINVSILMTGGGRSWC
jgi:hypothetical protein